MKISRNFSTSFNHFVYSPAELIETLNWRRSTPLFYNSFSSSCIVPHVFSEHRSGKMKPCSLSLWYFIQSAYGRVMPCREPNWSTATPRSFNQSRHSAPLCKRTTSIPVFVTLSVRQFPGMLETWVTWVVHAIGLTVSLLEFSLQKSTRNITTHPVGNQRLSVFRTIRAPVWCFKQWLNLQNKIQYIEMKLCDLRKVCHVYCKLCLPIPPSIIFFNYTELVSWCMIWETYKSNYFWEKLDVNFPKWEFPYGHSVRPWMEIGYWILDCTTSLTVMDFSHWVLGSQMQHNTSYILKLDNVRQYVIVRFKKCWRPSLHE